MVADEIQIEQLTELKKAYYGAVTIGVVTVITFFICAWGVSFVNSSVDSFEGLFPLIKGDTLKFVLLGTTVAVSLLIRLVKYVLPSGKITIQLPERIPQKLKIKSDVVQRLLLTSMIIFSLCELVAFFGVAVFLVSGQPLDFYIFLVMALMLIATNFPMRKDWEETVIKLQDKDKGEGK